MRICSVDGCTSTHRAKGFCWKHYLRVYRHGSTEIPVKDPVPRFWSKVDKNGPVPETRPDLGRCWIWTDSIAHDGYGLFTMGKGKNVRPYRYSYMLANGDIPHDLVIDHLCVNRACLNPGHLEAVTRAENNRRAARHRCLSR